MVSLKKERGKKNWCKNDGKFKQFKLELFSSFYTTYKKRLTYMNVYVVRK